MFQELSCFAPFLPFHDFKPPPRSVEHQLKAAQEEDVLVKAAMADKLAFFQFLDATFFATLKTEVRGGGGARGGGADREAG